MKKLISIILLLTASIIFVECSIQNGVGDDLKASQIESGKVVVFFKKEASLKEAYDFSQVYSDGILAIGENGYYANWPTDSLQYISNYIKHMGLDAKVTIGDVSNRIEILARFVDYDNDKAKAQNWVNQWSNLSKNSSLKLEEIEAEKIMYLYIYPGIEKVWIDLHKDDSIVEYAGFLYSEVNMLN